MKVICDRGALMDAINVVSGVVVSRSPRQQLTCVKLSAEREGDVGMLTLTGTDGEISLRLRLERVDVEEPGEALIPADKLRQIVSAEDSEPTLTLETDGDVCQIRGVDAYFRVYGFPSTEFPPIPGFTEIARSARTTFSHDAGAIGDLIARTLFATARESSRYAINGVLLNRTGKKLEFVATDGRRLALCRTTLKQASEENLSVIIPTKALNMLQKMIDDPDEPIAIAMSDAQALFAIGGEHDEDARAVLITNLVEGTFPPYEDVIPKDQDKTVVFDRDVLSSAVRRAALLTNEDSRGVRLTFKGQDRLLELSSRAPELGEAEIKVELAEYKGDDIEIGFNPAFIIDALKVIDDPQVVMELKAHNKPGLVKSGNDFMYVVMPVNLA